jgi:uncharacterized membrane protein YfcA
MAVPMIVGNVIGNWFGSHIAIKNSDLFVKYMMFVSLLLLVVSVAYKVFLSITFTCFSVVIHPNTQESIC